MIACGTKNVGAGGKGIREMPFGEAFCQLHMPLHMQLAIGEIDQLRCVSYFPADPYDQCVQSSCFKFVMSHITGSPICV